MASPLSVRRLVSLQREPKSGGSRNVRRDMVVSVRIKKARRMARFAEVNSNGRLRFLGDPLFKTSGRRRYVGKQRPCRVGLFDPARLVAHHSGGHLGHDLMKRSREMSGHDLVSRVFSADAENAEPKIGHEP